jgi:hypothetical protein
VTQGVQEIVETYGYTTGGLMWNQTEVEQSRAMGVSGVAGDSGFWGVSDEVIGTIAPIAVYWIYGGMYHLLPPLDQYRLHTRKEEDQKNLVSKSAVVKGVLLQQAIQAVVSMLLFIVCDFSTLSSNSQFVLGFVILRCFCRQI